MCLVEKIEQINTLYLEYRIFYKKCSFYKNNKLEYWGIHNLDNLEIVNKIESNEFLNWHNKIKEKYDRERT